MVKFLFWLFIIYIAYRILTGYIFPFVLKRYIRKQQKKYSQAEQNGESYQTTKDDVRIKIPRQKSRQKNVADNVGEYTDFEEEPDPDGE